MRLLFKSNPDINPVFVGLGFLFTTLTLLLVVVLIYSASVVSAPPQTETQIEDTVESLQDTTEELRQTVDALIEAAEDTPDTSTERLEDIDETLTDVDTRLDQIEQNLEADQTSAISEESPQDELLMTAGWVVGGLSVLIAMLSTVVWWQRSRQRKRLHVSLNSPVSPRT